MFEHFKNEFLFSISNHFDSEQLSLIENALVSASRGYEFNEKCTDVAIYSDRVPKLVELYLFTKFSENKASGTLSNVKSTLRSFFLTVGKQPEEITANDIRLYLMAYNQSREVHGRKPVKAITLDKYREQIANFFSWCVDEEYLTKNPAKSVKQIKHDKEHRHAITADQLEMLRSGCQTLREKALIEFLFSTGCRISDAVNAELSSINWQEKSIRIYVQKSRKYNTVYLTPRASLMLKSYIANERKGDSPYIFPAGRAPYRKMTTAAARNVVENAARRVFGDDVKITPHIIRHTSATLALKHGMPLETVQTMLCHSDIKTTMHYIDTNDDMTKMYHEKCVV